MTKETNTNNNFYKWPKIEFRAKVAAAKSVSAAALFNVDLWIGGLRVADWKLEYCGLATHIGELFVCYPRFGKLYWWNCGLIAAFVFISFFFILFVLDFFRSNAKKYGHCLLLGPAATWAHLSVGASVDLLLVICKIHCLAIFAVAVAVVCWDFFLCLLLFHKFVAHLFAIAGRFSQPANWLTN